MAIELPKFVCVKSKLGGYMRLVTEVDDEEDRNQNLEFEGDEVVSPFKKFQVERAGVNNAKGLVHIRCCFNNKYWVKMGEKCTGIGAVADEPEEDQSKWSCTLFRPDNVGGDPKAFRFFHVNTGRYAEARKSCNGVDRHFCVSDPKRKPTIDGSDVYKILDWESILILPRHITFKADNGKYLSTHKYNGCSHVGFLSADSGDPSVGYEVFPAPDGNARIRSNHFGMFWREENTWIFVNGTDEQSTVTEPNSLFWPVKVDDNLIALRNVGKKYFCVKRQADEVHPNIVQVTASTITKHARLYVEEFIISRKIYNVRFHLSNARIYNKSVLTMTAGDVTNHSCDDSAIDLKLSYKDTKSSTWSNSFSLKSGIKCTFQAGIPFIPSSSPTPSPKVKISAKFCGKYQWGETIGSSTTTEFVHRVVVPPMTRVRVRLIATMGYCDVPFSYTQTDTLMNGEQVTYAMDDGMYTGVNNFDFKYESDIEKLC